MPKSKIIIIIIWIKSKIIVNKTKTWSLLCLFQFHSENIRFQSSLTLNKWLGKAFNLEDSWRAAFLVSMQADVTRETKFPTVLQFKSKTQK